MLRKNLDVHDEVLQELIPVWVNAWADGCPTAPFKAQEICDYIRRTYDRSISLSAILLYHNNDLTVVQRMAFSAMIENNKRLQQVAAS